MVLSRRNACQYRFLSKMASAIDLATGRNFFLLVGIGKDAQGQMNPRMEKMVRLEKFPTEMSPTKNNSLLSGFSFAGSTFVPRISSEACQPSWQETSNARTAANPNQANQRASAPTKSSNPSNPQASPRGKTEREPIWVADALDANGDGYFRRTMDLPRTEKAQIEFRASEYCEVYLNGQRLAMGRKPGNLNVSTLQPQPNREKMYLPFARLIDQARLRIWRLASFSSQSMRSGGSSLVTPNGKPQPMRDRIGKCRASMTQHGPQPFLHRKTHRPHKLLAEEMTHHQPS